MGFGTRSEVKKAIKQKRVTIDGKITNVTNSPIVVEEQTITVDGIEVNYQAFFYFLMHKPQGVISATKDNMHETVIDILSPEDRKKDVFPVGRLDIDTEGLLLLTNDGQLTHQLLSPKKQIPKVYYAKVEGLVTQEDAQKLEEGVTLSDGYECMPAHMKIIKTDDISEIELTINEGKFHQVKRMMEAIGKGVIYLKRIGMGNLKLPDDIPLGGYRAITKQEKDLITMNDQTR